MSELIYPFDPTGSNAANRITDEQHVITAANYRDYHYIIPKAAPFFEDSLQLTAKATDGSTLTLTKGVHYYLTHQFIGASRACAKPVFASITFLYNDFAGVVKLTYQTLGGIWTLDEEAIAEILANSLLNPRSTSWEQVAGYPTNFPVIDHAWDLVDMVGVSELNEKLVDVRDAILQASDSNLPAHLADKNNPHDTTKAQVGLGLVENYPIASQTQAEAGAINTAYMTPLRSYQQMVVVVPTLFAGHTNNKSNPHETTKVQVGLGLVDNFATATAEQVVQGSAANLFVTPAGVKAAISAITGGFDTHVNDLENPHAVTKAQVGLGNVSNFAVASSTDAMQGTANDKYMTPLRVAQAIAQISTAALNAHLSDYTNPHQTNKTQVGLGNVDNYVTASQAQALDENNSSSFMTPQRTAQAIASQVGDDFVLHLNADNPHNVSKAQVGLGLVENYPIASDAEAVSPSVVNRYMTPHAVSLAISAATGGSLTDHLSNYSNPHQVTKAQVGLGSVDNFATATESEGVAGSATNKFMTPYATHSAIVSLLNTHAQDTSNPHAVTKAQVGLGNVQNYDVAADASSIASAATTLYATASGVKLYIDQVFTNFDQHISNINNPHNVTAAQVGLGNVQNYPIATQQDAEDGFATDRYMTPQRTNNAITVLGGALISNYAARRDNPNQVTAAQVGSYTTAETDGLLSPITTNVSGLRTDLDQLRSEFEAYKTFVAGQIQSLADQIGAG